MTIFDRIRQKTGQIAQGVGNFIDRDKSMPGVQITPGGVRGGIDRVVQGYQQNPNQYNVLTQMRNGGLDTGVKPLDTFTNRVSNTAPLKFAESRVIKPVTDIPSNIGTILDRNKGVGEKIIAGLSTAGAFIPGVDDAVVAGLNKVQEAATSGNKDVLALDYTPTPLGNIARERGIDGAAATALDIAELPLMLGSVLATGKGADQLLKRGDEVGSILKQGARYADELKTGANVADDVSGIIKSGAAESIAKNVDGTKVFNDYTKNVAENIPSTVRKSKVRRAAEAVAVKPKRILESSGESGKEIVKLLDAADEQTALVAGAQKTPIIEALNSLSKQEKVSLADVIEGNAKPISEAQAGFVELWRSTADDIQKRAVEAGLDTGYLENYFPHFSKKTGELQEFTQTTGKDRFGQLEKSRLGQGEYDKDPSVLLNYIEKANERITRAKNFGKDDEVLYMLAQDIGKQGGDTEQAITYIDQILNKNQPISDVANAVTGFQTVIKMGPTSPITNLTQNLSISARTDPLVTASAIKDVITDLPGSIRNARLVNEIDSGTARVLDDLSASGDLAGGWLKAIGHVGSEKLNRIIAVNAGIKYTNKMIDQAKSGNKAALRELDRLGFNIKNLDEINPLAGGRRISQQTQFSTKAGEIPYAWKTPLGRIATQFKSFAYKQSGFIKDQAIRSTSELVKGNPKPMINLLGSYGIGGSIVGELVNNIKAIITNKEREDTDNIGERLVSNIAAASSLGLLDNAPALFGKYGVSGVLSSLLGPTASDVVKGAEAVTNLQSGEDYKVRKTVRDATKMVPGVGRTAANTFIPNSYVDNLDFMGRNLGVNEGLGEKDKQTYRNIKEINPQQAEAFKEKQQGARGEDRGFVENLLFGGKKKESQLSIPTGKVSADERKAFNDQVDNILNAGVVPSKDSLEYAIFDKKKATSKSIEERNEVFKNIKSALQNEDYTDEQKKAIIEASGAKQEDVDYFMLASKDQEVRLQEMLPKLDNMSDKELSTFLTQGRRVVGNKQLVNNGVIDYLYENDYISKEESKFYKAVIYDEINDEFQIKKSYKGGGSGSGGSGGDTLTYNQALKLFKIEAPKLSEISSISNLLKNYSGTSSQRDRQGDILIENILRS